MVAKRLLSLKYMRGEVMVDPKKNRDQGRNPSEEYDDEDDYYAEGEEE